MDNDFETRLFRLHLDTLSYLVDTHAESSALKPALVANIILEVDDGPQFKISGDDGDELGPPTKLNPAPQLPSCLAECFISLESRRLLFLSFHKLLISAFTSLEAMVQATKYTIPQSTEWFCNIWHTDALDGIEDACTRMKIFGCMKKLFLTISAAHPPPENREALKLGLKRALSLQAISDILSGLFMDIDQEIPDDVLLDWAWKCYVNDEPGKYATMGNLLGLLDDARFIYPNLLDEERLVTAVKHPSARIDMIRLLLNYFETFGRMTQLSKENIIKKTPPKRRFSIANQVVERNWIAISEVWSLKAEWIAKFMNKHSMYFTVLNAQRAIEICAKVSSFVDPAGDNEIWQSVLADFRSKLGYIEEKEKMAEANDKIPPLVMNEEINPSNVSLLLGAKVKDETISDSAQVKASIPETSSLVSLKSSCPTATVKHMNVIAGLDEIRFQVDPSAERIVLKMPNGVQEPNIEEILTSSMNGTLVLTRREIIWSVSPLDFTNPDGFSYVRSTAFRVRHSAIIRFSAVELKKAPPNFRHNSSFSGFASTAILQVSQAGSRMASAIFFPGSFQKKEEASKSDNRTQHAIVIHTRQEAFKFYPFSEDEAVKMLQALSSVAGMAPFKSSEFVKSVLTKRVEVTRRQALRQLLQEEHPWINNLYDLTVLINALISETRPQLIVDMERLFHSCKLESEVTKETIAILRKAWHHTQSDQTRLKILSIVDRILDRVIMRQDDTVFAENFTWLKHLEETINPYRSPEILRLVLYLLKRAKAIQVEPLAPLPHDQSESMFDHFDEYRKLMQFSEDFGIKLHVSKD